ncbi:MAG: 3-hydroxyacyl-CoA dehydrogenase/enoyl-CoA hydratase family protein [Deltaproteobacteria bacterium]|nr:3-hydroxyacyl-CoA dehydrogenase/enoyl-CoA hydratase family protein [Deltaproteobacteria bacterium]
MPITVKGRTIHKVAVVGSGNIGPDIAMHFAQNLAPEGVKVVVVDVVQKALDGGKARIDKKLGRLAEKGIVKPEAAKSAAESILWTMDYGQIGGADLVVEAATEDEGLKKRIFAQVEKLVPPAALLTSNSSHMEPEVIFAGISDKGRTACVHYFFPAERNIVVEVIPGAETAPATTAFLMRFYERIGKMPLRVKSRYGYSVDPIFEGNFLAAALLVEEGAGSIREVDEAARKALGLGVGPFTAMNLTGGNPITNHGLEIEGQKIMPWYRSPKSLQERVKTGVAWEVAGKGETVEVPAAKAQRIADDMLGAFFGMAAEIVDSGIASIGDLDVAVETALVMKPPFRTMNKLGVGKALALVESYAARHPGFKVADVLRRQAASGKPFEVPFVFREDVDGVAVVTIRRPAVLNALNAELLRQIREHFEAIGRDPQVVGAVLTGFGTRAFVSGADVNELVTLPDGEAMKRHALAGQQACNVIENLGKPVVCAMNGLAFGGGNEIAMACTARIARSGQKVFVGQPEVKLGIIPGLGGTQRLPRLVGLANAWPILRNGDPISSAKALEIGLIAEEVGGDVRDRAIELVRDIAAGKAKPRVIERKPLEVPAKLPEVELGHLSKAIDRILQRAVVEGARKTLEEGLLFEAEMLASCHGTKDMRIGLDNFVKNGPKANAAFTHE